MLRISVYSQTGPYKDRPGFGVVAEAMGGLRHLTAEPGRVPVRVGVSIGDTLASLHGVIGISMALPHRHASVSASAPMGRGQVIDVALDEAVFNCMESLLPEYSAFGVVREPAGSALLGIAPTNAYLCADGWVLVAGNGDSIFRRLMKAIGRIYTAKDIAEDPHYRARGMIQQVTTAEGLSVEVPGIVPKLSLTPDAIRRRAPTLDEDRAEVRGEQSVGPKPSPR